MDKEIELNDNQLEIIDDMISIGEAIIDHLQDFRIRKKIFRKGVKEVDRTTVLRLIKTMEILCLTI